MPCGHCMHHKCHQQHIHTSYQCPTCLKSLADMSEYFRRIDIALSQHQMPVEYRNTFSQIYCNDCEKRSHAKFHFMYHKCGHCKGYNTKLLGTVQGLPLDAVIAPDVQIQLTPQEQELARTPDALQRLASSSSILSSQSSSSVASGEYTGSWCHQCQVFLYLCRDLPNWLKIMERNVVNNAYQILSKDSMTEIYSTLTI